MSYECKAVSAEWYLPIERGIVVLAVLQREQARVRELRRRAVGGGRGRGAGGPLAARGRGAALDRHLPLRHNTTR